MTRRAFLTLPAVLSTPTAVTARAGLHVTGQLVEDTSDLQAGYFALCGATTGMCKAEDAIAISVHPKNAQYLDQLRAMVGRPTQISIFTT